MNSSKKTYWLDCLFNSPFGTLYSLFLGHYALISPDEGRYAEIGREMLVSGHYLVPRLNYILYFEKPPFFYWLTALSLKLFGLNEWAVRLWPILFSIAGCLITYITAHIYYGRKTGLLAAGILGTSLLYFAIGHLATIDMTVSLLITATLVAFLLGVQTPIGLKRRGYFYLAAVCAAFAVLTKGLIGFVFPIMIIGLWVLLLNKWKELKTWYLPTTILIALLIAAPWHIYMQIKYPAFLSFILSRNNFHDTPPFPPNAMSRFIIIRSLSYSAFSLGLCSLYKVFIMLGRAGNIVISDPWKYFSYLVFQHFIIFHSHNLN